MGAQFTDVSHSCGDLASGFMALEKHCFHLCKQTDPCLMQITCSCVIHEGALSLTSSHSLPSHPPQHTSAGSISHAGQVVLYCNSHPHTLPSHTLTNKRIVGSSVSTERGRNSVFVWLMVSLVWSRMVDGFVNTTKTSV